MQSVLDHLNKERDDLEKEMDNQAATFCEESKIICVTDILDERLKLDAFRLSSEERGAFTEVNSYLEIEEAVQQNSDFSSVLYYIRNVLDIDRYELPAEEKVRLQAMKNYLEQATKDQEMLVVNQEDNEKISRL